MKNIVEEKLREQRDTAQKKESEFTLKKITLDPTEFFWFEPLSITKIEVKNVE